MKIVIEAKIPEGVKPKQVFTIEPDDKEVKVSFQLVQRGNWFEPVDKTISQEEFKQLFENISALDFKAIYKEPVINDDIENLSIKCTIIDENAELSVLMWAPKKDAACPQTTKLLLECEKIFDLFDNIEVRKNRVHYDQMTEKKVDYKVRYIGEESWLLRNNIAYKCFAELYDSKGNLDSVCVDTGFPLAENYKLYIEEVIRLED